MNAQRTSSRRSWVKRLAWSAWALATVQVALALPLVGLNGVSPRRLLADFTLAVAVGALAFATVGALIAAHRPGNAIGWLFLAAGVGNGLFAWTGEYARYALVTQPGTLPGGEIAFWLNLWLWAPVEAMVGLFLPMLFPHGHLPSPRWRAPAWLGGCGLVLFSVGLAFSPKSDSLLPGIENPFLLPDAAGVLGVAGSLGIVLLLAGMLGAIAAAVVRFRRARGAERQQFKWMAAGAGLLAVAQAGSTATFAMWGHSAGGVVLAVAFPCLSLATGIAILRHRLYDIDVIINRALVYGLLTATLALVYFGGVALLQQGVWLSTGEASSQFAVVATTLAIAALFQPLRRRIQSFIDRRFYRRKYDAARTLAAFGATLRDETDLDRLSAYLLATVQETMQPAQVSLWLRPMSGTRVVVREGGEG